MAGGFDARLAGCAHVRRDAGEALHATAPERAQSWLLVEHPGPWPSLDLPSDLPSAAVAVVDAATQAGVRPHLIRRVTARRRAPATVVLASCRPGDAWLERRTLDDLRELQDLDVEALADGRRPHFGAATAEPVVLVCTHGRRDVCCARLGRPLAVLLDAQLPGQVWETTHVGGDRFAPNVVALPAGTYHGGATVSDVPALAHAVLTNGVHRPLLRGRAGLPSAVQAADFFLRERLDVADVAAVVPVSSTPSPSGGVCVELLVDGQRWCVHVRATTAPVPRLTSCASGGTVDTPTSFELVHTGRPA